METMSARLAFTSLWPLTNRLAVITVPSFPPCRAPHANHRQWATEFHFYFVCVSVTKTSGAKFKNSRTMAARNGIDTFCRKKLAAASGGSGDPVIAMLPSVTHFVRALDAPDRTDRTANCSNKKNRIKDRSNVIIPLSEQIFTAFLVSGDADKPQKRRNIVLRPIDMKTGDRT
jgi:hypothetical protein